MQSPRLIEHNALQGITEIFHPHEDGGFTIETRQQIGDTLEVNREQRKLTDRHAGWGEGQIVARIPMVILADLMRSGQAYDNSAMKRWLNDPANVVFRTREGKI